MPIFVPLYNPPTDRELLTAARTYYVRTDGSDGNTGLANTAGGAFLTIQHAIDVVAGLDSGIYNVTIQIADGTYVTAGQITCKNMVGAGRIIISGNAGTPANVVIDSGFLKSTPGTVYQFQHVKLVKSSSSATEGLSFINGAYCEFTNLNFGAGYTYQISVNDHGEVVATGNYAITGSASWSHYKCSGSGVFRVESITITLTGTPGFTVFSHADSLSYLYARFITFTGGATGPRYYAATNAVIDTAGGGANYFPGDSAGWVETGGQYV